MTQTNDTIMAALSSVALPDGGDLASRDMIRALNINGGRISFVIEAETPEKASTMEDNRESLQRPEGFHHGQWALPQQDSVAPSEERIHPVLQQVRLNVRTAWLATNDVYVCR